MIKIPYLWIILFILMVAFVGLTSAYMIQRAELKRVTSNQIALMDDVKFLRLKDSSSVAEIKTLKLTKSEFKQYYGYTNAIIKSAGIKSKDVTGVTTTAITTDVKIDVPLIEKDSLKCIEYQDKFTLISGCITPSDSFVGIFHSIDSIYAIRNIERRKFLFIRYGIKASKLTIVSKNPNSTIILAEEVEIVKK